MKTAVYKRVNFNAAHRLFRPDWSDEKNNEVFGLCANPHFHGHNYTLEVKVIGEISPETGFVIDLGDLKKIIMEKVVNRLDHHNLNTDIPEFKDLNPTAENIAKVIFEILRPELSASYDLQIRLFETPRNFVDYPV